MFGLGCHVFGYDSNLTHNTLKSEDKRRNSGKSRTLHINLEFWQVCCNFQVAGREKKIQFERLITSAGMISPPLLATIKSLHRAPVAPSEVTTGGLWLPPWLITLSASLLYEHFAGGQDERVVAPRVTNRVELKGGGGRTEPTSRRGSVFPRNVFKRVS